MDEMRLRQRIGDPRRPPLVRSLATVVFLAVLIAGCGSSATSAAPSSTAPATTTTPSTTTPALTQQVSFRGLSLWIPAGYAVRPYSGCPATATATAWVGAPVQRSGRCTSGATVSGTGMILSTAAITARHGGSWQLSETINAIAVKTSVQPTHAGGSCTPSSCVPLTELIVLFPAYQVGAEFLAPGARATTSLALARSILRTVELSTSF